MPDPTGRHGVSGALVIDKPPGITSHDVVAAVRRTLAVKVGHTGTLDPMATGVLPLLVGHGTRLARFFGDATKVYEARVRFGWATDTCDATGRAIGPEQAVTIDPRVLEEALARFRGVIEQTPPAYSAKKVEGRRAYAMARADERPALSAVPVTVHALKIVACSGSEAVLEVTCSAGFYVRALAHDLGATLGCGAHLAGLRRLASGPFALGDAVALDRVLRNADEARASVVPMERLLEDIPAVRVSQAALERVARGQDIRAGDVEAARGWPDGAWVRVMAPDGTLAAVAVSAEGVGVLHPAVVLM